MKNVEEDALGSKKKDDELKLRYIELQLKKKEIELQETNANLTHDLERLKIIVTGVVVTLITSIISWQIQNQQVEIERLSSEQNYITSFAEQALQSDLKSRYAFADYLSTIAHSKSSRNRWSDYKDRVEILITIEEGKEKEISELRDQIAALSDEPKKNRDEIQGLERVINDKEAELKRFQDSQTVGVSTQDFVFSYDLDSRIIEGGRFIWRDAIVAKSGEESIPVSQEVVDTIVKTAISLKEVEDFLGQPVEVVEWYRTPEQNARVGGASLSNHLTGEGIDITVEGISSQELYEKLNNWWGARGGLGVKSEDIVHLDRRGFRVRWTDISPSN